jgi:hypothetical protein
MKAEVPAQQGSRLPLPDSCDMVLAENARMLGQLDPDAVERLTDLITAARRVFVAVKAAAGWRSAWRPCGSCIWATRSMW